LLSLKDLWLDEIWTINSLLSLYSPLEVFTTLKHDNNHILNSLITYALLKVFPLTYENLWILKIPSLVFALLSFVLFSLISNDSGSQSERVFGTVIVFFSYILFLYGTEVRGYASLLFFCLLTFFLYKKLIKKGHDTTLMVLFIVATIFGVLSHITFLNFFLPLLGYALFQHYKKDTLLQWKETIFLFGLPLLFTILIIDLHYKGITIGGGPEYSYLNIIPSTISIFLGGPTISYAQPDTIAVVFGYTLFAVLFFVLYYFEHTKENNEKVFFALVLPVFILLFFIVVQPRYVYPRYLIPNMIFMYLIFAKILSILWDKNRCGKAVALLFISIYIIGNCYHILGLYNYGRGGYVSMLQTIASQKKEGMINVTGEYPFRDSTIIDFYSKLSYKDKREEDFARIRYTDSLDEAEFYLQQSQDYYATPQQKFSDKQGKNFELVSAEYSAVLSGWSWFLYRRIKE
jgi:uncharacterized membrane protein YwzB